MRIVTLVYPRYPKGEGGILFYLCPFVQDIFRRIFLSNCCWQKSAIWSQALYNDRIVCSVFGPVRFIFPVCRLSWFLYTEHISTFFVTFFSATINGRNLIFGHKLHIGTPYRRKRFWTHQIPTSCLPT